MILKWLDFAMLWWSEVSENQTIMKDVSRKLATGGADRWSKLFRRRALEGLVLPVVDEQWLG